MRNDRFWDECSNGSIREAVASFIDNSTLLSHYKGEKYFQLEDEIVRFIEERKESIFREVLAEYYRDDVRLAIENRRSDGALALICDVLPNDVLTKIVDDWQDELENNTDYCDARNMHLDRILDSTGMFDEAEEHGKQDIELYAAYVEDWYKQHFNEKNQYPVCIKEFFDCEMQDEELRSYYLALTKLKRYARR